MSTICFCGGTSNGYPLCMFFVEALLMSTHKICFCGGTSNEYPQCIFFVDALLMSTHNMFLWRHF